jgi:hypothetical protein
MNNIVDKFLLDIRYLSYIYKHYMLINYIKYIKILYINSISLSVSESRS